MSRENYILQALLTNGEVIWNPKGNSMIPKINSGDQVTIKSYWELNSLITYKAVRVNDIVFAKVKGSYYLHLVSAIDTKGRYQISNNHGYINGWASPDNVYGLCIKVKDKTLLTEDEIKKRILEANQVLTKDGN